MPVTFGAVGDIISVCHLVKGLVDALDKARGSKAEYLSAVQELSILEKVLFEIACIIEEHGDGATPELQSLCETAKQAFTRCEALVDAFLQRTRRYQGTLTETAKPEVLHEATMKLRWRLAEKEALKKFRVEVAGISESLQMLLGAANIILRTETKVKLEEADQRYQAANSIQRAQLKDFLDRIENVNESIKTGNVMLYKIADALKMDWLRQLGSELKLLLYRSVAVNFATYQAVRRQQTPLPSHLEHGLIDEPFILEDAIGRKAPVHLQFITSWEAFDSILEIRFRGRQGHQKVIHKQYELQDGRTGRNLERSQSWERAFLPGQRVQMSILFHKQRPIDSGCAGIICPGCQTPAENALETDIHCKQCFIWYSRIAVVEYADHWEHAILGRLHKISSGDVSTENDIDFISDFTRVRIMSIQSGKTRRLRHYHYCNVCPSDTKMAYMCFNTFSYHFYQKHMWSLHSHAQSGFVCCSKVFEEESLLKHVWGRHVYRTYPPAQHLD